MGPDRWALNLDEDFLDQASRVGQKIRDANLWMIRGKTNRQAQDMASAARKDGLDKGFQSGKIAGQQTGNIDKVSDLDVYKTGGERAFKSVGKGLSNIGKGAGDAMSSASSGVRQGLEDNPAGIAGAAAGALAAGWGLSKLRRKKAPV